MAVRRWSAAAHSRAGGAAPNILKTLGIVTLVVWVMALGRTLLNLLLIPRLRGGAPSKGPRVSVIIPARDEARSIEKSVRAWIAQRYQDLEIIVVDDRSKDDTGAILDRLAAESPRLSVIHGVEPPAGWLGKQWALHQGTRRATGELVLFVDADLYYGPNAVAGAVGAIQHARVSLMALLPRIEMKGFWEHVSMPALGVTLFMMLPTWLANRTRFAWGGIGGGTGNLVRRADYDAVGGHEALRTTVVDDIGLARLLRRNGFRTMCIRADEHVSLRMYHGGGEVVEGFTKNLFSAMGRNYVFALLFLVVMVGFSIPPYVLAFTGDGLALASVGLITASRVVTFGTLGYRLDNAILGHPLSTLFWAFVLARSVWVTGVRKRFTWRGRVHDATRLQGVE